MNLLKSFHHAVMGISRAVNTERNFRIHLVFCAYVFFFARFYNLSRAEWGILVLTVAVVLVAELINTAVEHTVDITISRYDTAAKLAKDVAAGGVLIAAIGAVLVGFILFFDVAIIKGIALFFRSNLFYLSALILSFIISFIFIRFH